MSFIVDRGRQRSKDRPINEEEDPRHTGRIPRKGDASYYFDVFLLVLIC